MKGINMMKVFFCLAVLAFVLNSFAYGDTHQQVQSVDNDGYGDHPDLFTSSEVAVEGIILNRPDFMLDATPDQNAASVQAMAKWQIYIQGEGDDHAATAVWMGQCYDQVWGGNGTYTDQQWLDELYRLSHDPCTGYEFAPGDRVRVTGLLKFYGGKTNINERHNTDPANDFTIELLEPAVGLPQPEVITLGDVKDGSDVFIFDPNRETGCEHYQGRLVKINNVNFVDANSWGPDAEMAITDGQKTFPLKLGLGYGFGPGSNNLSATFDVVGIFDQEGGLKDGYRIWVLNYDGNGRVLTDRGGSYNLPGEINKDGRVDMLDFVRLADNWLECVPGTGACGGSN